MAVEPPEHYAEIDTGFGYSQGECCYYWYYGTPTKVSLPRIGPAVLTTYFIQCLTESIYICDPQYSDLLLTFERLAACAVRSGARLETRA